MESTGLGNTKILIDCAHKSYREMDNRNQVKTMASNLPVMKIHAQHGNADF